MSKRKEWGLYATCGCLALIAAVSLVRSTAGEQARKAGARAASPAPAAVALGTAAAVPAAKKPAARSKGASAAKGGERSQDGGRPAALALRQVVPAPLGPWPYQSPYPFTPYPYYPYYPSYPSYPTQQPFQQEVTVPLATGQNQGTAGFTAPLGGRMVIEHVTCSVVAFQAGVARAGLTTTVNGYTATHRLPLGPGRPGLEAGSNLYEASDTVRIYADGGTPVVLTLQRSGWDGPGQGNFSLSGYLSGVNVVSGFQMVAPQGPLTPP